MKYAYIDESGTREYQGVMTVALIVLEGRRTAEKLHEKVMCTLFEDYIEKRKLFKKKAIHRLPYLHYTEMSRNHRERVGVKLAAASVSAYVSYYWHDGKATKHEQRFEIYTNLVKESILLATRDHNELSVTVAQQGGWQGYERQFEQQLKALEYDHTNGRMYRRLTIKLNSARHPGIQLSDFYAGVSRDFIINPDDEPLLTAFRAVESQIVFDLSSFVPIEKG
jgi:hypothetical protein